MPPVLDVHATNFTEEMKMIQIQTDSKGQRYIEWARNENVPDGNKRAWISAQD